ILFKALELGFPPIIGDIYFTEEEISKGRNYERIPISTYQHKEKKQDKSQRPSVIEFLFANEVKNLYELQTYVRKKLKSLASLNPKIVNLGLLHRRLIKFHQEINASAAIIEFPLEPQRESKMSNFFQSLNFDKNSLFHVKKGVDEAEQSSTKLEKPLSP